ncbi:MAG: TlpA family protein disulfide reductase [Phycisphaerales bacterium]|jgi:thiol-disulfide isomerase/thioredoxin|nr:TlpA family protein disulfide reductase [Phycisphaerales bacterium]
MSPPRLFIAGAMLALLAASSIAANELKPYSGTVADFAAQDLQGKPVRFAAFRGKVVLLNFWATWCPPCRKEMPAMERLHRAYRERGLVVLAVSQDEAPLEEVRRFAVSLGLTFPVWHDRAREAARHYSLPGVPTSYLIAHDGQLAYRVLGEYDWDGREAHSAVELLLDEAGK